MRNNYQFIGMQGVPPRMFSSPQPEKRKMGWSGEGGDVAVRYLHISPTEVETELIKHCAL